MRIIALLLVLLVICSPSSSQAAECFKVKESIEGLIGMQFVPKLILEKNHQEIIYFVNQRGDWMSFSVRNENTMCLESSGRAFFIVPEKKL